MYREIDFIDTDTEIIVNNLIKSYEEESGDILYPADPKRLFLFWIAKILAHERVIINETAKQNIPRYAKGEFLDAICEMFGDVKRLDKQFARATFEFTISAPQESVIVINAGTRISVDGELMFYTLEDAEIKIGETTTEALAKANKAGTIGNGFIPGQITEIIDIFPFYESVKNITTSDGGADEESDVALYERLKDSTDAYSTAGPERAYIYHTKSASSLVGDVSVRREGPGEVGIRIITNTGEIPSEELINLVQNTLDKGEVRPLTDKVIVKAPEIISFNVDITYYTPRNMASEKSKEIIETVVKNYIKWQTEKLGRDINPSYLISMLMNTGIKRVEVRSPTFKVLQKNEVAKLSGKNIINGGVEDE